MNVQMNEQMNKQVKSPFKGELLFDEILAPHTSWHIGGKADCYFSPFDLSDLQMFLASLAKNEVKTGDGDRNKEENAKESSKEKSEEPLTWLGLGSNVLIADEGIRGTVIHTLGMKSEIEKISDSIIRVEMGIPCAKLAKFCAKNALNGGAFFAGIPGTIGGALAMNAGAFGGETWSRVVKVEVISPEGKVYSRMPEEYDITYRSVQRKTFISKCSREWFVAGYFQFEPGESSESATEIKHLLKKRSNSQPIGVFSCGSVFKNPRGTFAAKLIETSQLKGFRIGGAEISTKHANFIINTGTATANDVLMLMAHIMEKVFKDHNIRLEPEVRILGYEDPYFWVPKHLRVF